MAKGEKIPLRLERRRFARFDIEWPVEYPLFGETAFANTENISRGGMLVAGVPILPEDEVEFSLHGVGIEPLVVVGRVCGSDLGTHVEFVDASGDAGPAIEQFIEHNVIPDLIGSLTGTRRDTQNLRLVSSWYRELGKEDRALDVCRGAIQGATSAGPYEELAGLLITRAKRLGARGGLEHILEARRVIGEGLKVVASPALVRLYQESIGIEERLRALLQWHIRQQQAIDRTTSQRPIPPELLEQARGTDLSGGDDMPTDPMMVVGAVTDPDLLATDPTIDRSQMVTDPSAIPPTGFATDAPLTDPMLVASAPRTTASVYEVSRRPRRRRGGVVALLLLVVMVGGGFGLWRLGLVRVPALEAPAGRAAAPAAATDELPLARLSPPPKPGSDEYAELAELEPDLLGLPPAPDKQTEKRHRRKAKRRRRARSRSAGDLFETEFRGAPVDAKPAEVEPDVDHYARATKLLKERKILLAIEELEALTREQPRHAAAFRMLGVAYNLVGRDSSSLDAFRRFVELAPAHKDAAKVRAIIADLERRIR